MNYLKQKWAFILIVICLVTGSYFLWKPIINPLLKGAITVYVTYSSTEIGEPQDGSFRVSRNDPDSLWQDIYSWTNFKEPSYIVEIKNHKMYIHLPDGIYDEKLEWFEPYMLVKISVRLKKLRKS